MWLNSPITIKGSTPTEVSTSSDTTAHTSSKANANMPEVSEISNLIKNLEKRMTSRIYCWNNGLLNLKDIIIKNLQVENERLRKNVNVLESKILTLDSDHNSLEQHGRRNTGILKLLEFAKKLRENVVHFLNEICELVLMHHQKILKCTMVLVSQKIGRRKQ